MGKRRRNRKRTTGSQQPEFEVEEIQGRRTEDDGTVSYFVKWKDYDLSHCSWEPEENLNCEDLLAAYERARVDEQSVGSRDVVPPQKKTRTAELSTEETTSERQPELPVTESEPVAARETQTADNDLTLHQEQQLPENSTASEDTITLIARADLASVSTVLVEYPVPAAGDANARSTSTVEVVTGAVSSQPSRPRSSRQQTQRTSQEGKEEYDSGDVGDGSDSDSSWSHSPTRNPPRAPPFSQPPPRSGPRQVQPPSPQLVVPPTPQQRPSQRQLGTGSLHEVYINTLVAFCPQQEPWLQNSKPRKKLFGVAGSTFIVGRVCGFKPRTAKFELRWLDTMFQAQPELVDLATVKRGRANNDRLQQATNNPRWRNLCRPDPMEAMDVEDLERLEEYTPFDPVSTPPATIHEVEQLESLRFVPDGVMRAPRDLFAFEDGSTTSYVRPEYRHLFESASGSFFAYIPVYYWKQVLSETNDHGLDVGIKTPFTLQELMTFLGILFYMAMVDKGEYQNYWGEQVEDVILKEKGAGLDDVMSLRRFKDMRRAFCFRNPASITQEEKDRDAAVRIRSLLNLLKVTGHKYLMVGRNLSIDEASLACRSKFGRHLIMFNPTKPGGKHHFRLYLCCCATTWVMLNFRLHCTSEMVHRLDGVVDAGEARALEGELSECAKVRQHVLELAMPFYHTKRVVNTDNYYTSIQLLEALRVKGLYGRGTVRRISKHFPRHVILGDDAKRGDSRQGVSALGIIGASSCDGNVVTIASNADPSTTTTITRLVKNRHVEYSGPT